MAGAREHEIIEVTGVGFISSEMTKRKSNTSAQPCGTKKKKRTAQSLAIEDLERIRAAQNYVPFCGQLEELLKEEILSERTSNRLNQWVEKIEKFLLSVEFSLAVQISDKEPVTLPNVLLPSRGKLKHVPISFKFIKPKTVKVFGSYSNNCVMKDSGIIDMAVEIPKEVFQREDYLNEKYFRKRNIYLSCLTSKLLETVENGLIDKDVNYVVTNDVDKPVLQLKSPDKKLRKFCIHVHVIPEKNVFPESRFAPTVNNVRYGWYFETTGDGKLNSATPFYNSIIRHDLVVEENEELRRSVFSSCAKFKDAFILLKIWIRQRHLDEGLGSFSGFFLSMFMVYLYQKKKLNHRMGIYEIIRIVWLAFNQTNWHTDGISLHEKESLDQFNSHYDVVFVDVTGTVNLTSALNLSTYLMIKSESKLAVEYLNDLSIQNFQALFMKPVQILYEFDHVIRFKKMNVIKRIVEQYADLPMQLDFRGGIHSQFLRIVTKLLKRALGSRVSCIFSRVEPSNIFWSVDEKMPRFTTVMIGFLLNPEYALNTIDRGPTANLAEAADFREFWGSKSELRRFKDGDTCETVCWAKSSDPLQKKRLIVRDIVHHIFEHRLKIQTDEYTYVADQIESIVFETFNELFQSKGTGEEVCLGVIDSFLDLSKILRQLKDLPLEITSVQGGSAELRYSALFPSLPHVQCGMTKNLVSDEKSTLFKTNATMQHVPLYIPPIEAVIYLLASNKWPYDLDAIRSIQASFYIKLCAVLENDYKLVCRPHYDHLDVIKDGYIFRLRISNSHEISAVKRQVDESGMVQYNDTEESLQLEKTLVQLPVLTSAIHGLHVQYSAFGAACIMAKRWIRSQLIDEFYFPDVCVDLLISYLCLNSAPYATVQQPQTLFLRFLKFVSAPDWFIDPIIVNFNGELSGEDILDIEGQFSEDRDSFPALLIVTPFDKSGKTWTAKQPSPMILRRLSKVASASLQIVESYLPEIDSNSALKQIFRPPLVGYDVLIQTFTTVNSCRWFAFDANADPNSLVPIKRNPEYTKLPIIDFHPVRSYVEKLRTYFGDQCLFFFDSCGGNSIGVLLKPDIKGNHDFKISNMKGALRKGHELVFHLPIMIDNFRNVGGNIVNGIRECKKK